MENNPSLDHLLMQVGEMIEMIQNHKGPISSNITPRVLANMDLLEEAVGFINELNQKAFELAGIDEKLKKETLESSSIKSKDKYLIERAENITRDARSLQLALSKAAERGRGKKKTKVPPKTAANKYNIKERRKLFKPLGGDKTWIPL